MTAFKRDLHPNTPLLHGPDVEALQRLLQHSPWGNFLVGTPAKGVYDDITARSVMRFKYRVGYASKNVNKQAGARAFHLLETGKLPIPFRIRRAIRLKQIQENEIRQRILMECKWGIAKSASIHYQQSRPIPFKQWDKHALPITTDCSGSAAAIYKRSGAKDPSGHNFGGAGYTGDMLKTLVHIAKADAKVGDLAVIGAFPGMHVVVLMEPGTVANPAVFSHGQEAGPLRQTIDAEVAAHGGAPVTYLRGV